METHHTVALVESDVRRRAAISHMLTSSRIHVEPFDSVQEITELWPRLTLALMHDHGREVARLTQEMGRRGCWAPIIAFAEVPAPGRIVEAILQGALDYLVWPFDAVQFAATSTAALGRAETLGHARLRATVARSRIERLTRRERQVLNGVAGGMSNRIIGEKLAISPRTVEIHRANMLTKIGATHTSEAIRIAIEADLLNEA